MMFHVEHPVTCENTPPMSNLSARGFALLWMGSCFYLNE